jgi:hypothetical protein
MARAKAEGVAGQMWGAKAGHGAALPVLDQFFPFQHAANLFESRINASLREPNVVKAMHVRKIVAPLFEKNDRSFEGEPALEQARFMDDIQARAEFSIRPLILGGQNQEREIRLIEHLHETFGGCDTGSRDAVELDRRQVKATAQKLF